MTLPQSYRVSASDSGCLRWLIHFEHAHIFVDKIVIGGPALAVVTNLDFTEEATSRRLFSATGAQLSALYGVPGAARVEVALEFFNATRGHGFTLHFDTCAEEKPPTDQTLVAIDVLQQQGLLLEERVLAALLRPQWPLALDASLEVLVGEAARVRMGDGALKIPPPR
jgi:hypothetical protein